MKTKKILQVVVELPEYINQSRLCMDEKSCEGFINFIAENPLEGDLITGTGGARKIRWTADINQGKRGGARIIYYYHNQKIPIFLFTAYGKNNKGNISQAEKKALKVIINAIVRVYEEINHE